ncbi:MAG: YbaK/EbsC family protein [Pirellulaceae bacterium]|nr:YbaK/EbsC family protein [Pirellulaceae bacterium]
MELGSEATLTRIRKCLKQAEITVREIEHAPTETSEASAAVRGEPLYVGAKALLLKTDEAFRLFVLPADEKLDSASVKSELGLKKLRFATREELFELTGLVPGSVPPFGEPVLPFELFADSTIGTKEDKVAFNAGSLTHSIIMTATVWKQIAKPQVFRFGK